ncbi:MAG: pyridoxal phosphate-dependent aminotransferase [Gemmatimonadetes bacterium]|nr:pyridoxal phosphate-dependent aminotransferase [Gemmatimonadota bacterium]
MEGVQSPIIPVVADWIRSCPGTISLGQGVVYYGPPDEAFEALAAFARAPQNKYGAVDGIPELREAIAAKLAAENGIEVGPAQSVVVTAGGNMAFINALLAVVDEGDEVVLPSPFYFNHEMAVTMVGGRVVTAPTADDFQLDPDSIRRALTRRTRAVVTVSPNNPTGAVYGAETLREVNDICREAGVYHISDEAYEYFTYGDARHFSPGSLPLTEAHTISLFSLSKAYGFASWRVGYMVIPAHLAEAVSKIQDTIVICPAVVSQHAALGALRAGVGYCREKTKAIAATRETVLHELAAIESICSVARADGALYFVLRVETDESDVRLVERLIREHGVAVIPGSTFGLDGGCYLRVSYGALDGDTVTEGIGRLVNGLGAIVGG